MIARLKAWAWLLLVLALAAGLMWQTLRLAAAEVFASKAHEVLYAQDATRARSDRAEITKKADALLDHAGAQQDNTHDYTQTLRDLETTRAANAGRIAGLQHDIRVTATRNAQLAGDLVACRDLADHHQRLAALAGGGAELVGRLGDLVKIRDAQVEAQKGQIAADGALLGR